MVKNSIVAIRVTLVFALLTGIFFPLIVTSLSQWWFPEQANGSLAIRDGQVIGSSLLAQPFTQAQYFHPRPSAAGSGYAGEASGGTNLGPTSKKLFLGAEDDPATKNVDESFKGVKQLAALYRQENGLAPDSKVPADAVTRSASGLDPDISVANAQLQAPRVAHARNLKEAVVAQIVREHTKGRQFGFFGEPRVNVLALNLALDRARSSDVSSH